MQIKHRGELPHLLDFLGLPSIGAEIGVAEGRFSKELLDNGLGFLYLIDIWEELPFLEGCASFPQEWHDKNYLEVRRQFEKDERVCILKGFSHKMASFIEDGSLSLVYLDGAHDYNSVKADIRIWWPKLRSGGILSGHDFGNNSYGVNRAIVEFMGGEDKINVIKEDGNSENFSFWVCK